MKKRFFAALASLCVMVSALPVVAFAEGASDSGTPLVPSTLVQSTQAQSALCEHHPSHDEACGYTEGTEGSPCTHEHDEDCYQLVTECVHEHSPECYPAESVSENTATPSQPEEAEPMACTHVCSGESGCITEVLDCKHEHDEACGYVPATEGTPCTFVCEVCNPQDNGNPATPSDAQPEECTCETLCTEEEINGDCPVCSAEGAELDKVCVGVAPMLPVTALAAAEGAPSSLYVGNYQITNSDTPTYLKAGSTQGSLEEGNETDWTVKYDPSTATLTLSGATIKGGSDVVSIPYGSGIYAQGSSNQPVTLTIELIGENTITGNFGIYVNAEINASSYGTNATLTIMGENNGSLEVSGSNNGIYVKSGTGNASLNIKNVAVTSSTNDNYAAGVYVMSSMHATSSPQLSLKVNGGSLTASGTGSRDGILFYVGSSQATGATTRLTVSENAIVDARNGGIKASDSSMSDLSDQIVVSSGDGTNGGIVFDGSAGTVYGDVTLDESLTINQGETLTIPEGSSLNANGKLTNDGTINVEDGGTVSGSLNDGTTITTPSISQQPQSTTVTEGQDATFAVTASDVQSYQWQQSTDNGSSWTNIESETSASYTINSTNTSMNGYQYRCVVMGSGGIGVISQTATLTVNELITYAITVHGSAGGTATADKTAAAADETVNLTATPDSGYHFERWEVVSGTVTIQNNQFIMPAENVEIRAVFDRNSSSGGSSGGSSYRDREYEFWMDVKEQIRDADPGDTIKANARTYDRMPWSVMEALREAEDVTLRITWNGGEDIIIPSAAALSEQNRIYYPLSYLEDMTFEVESEAPAADPDKVNPETGGILEVTAPVTADSITTPAGEPEVTDSRRGLAETPELAEEGIEQTLPGIYEPEETVTTSTTEETGTSGLLITGVVAVLAAAGGFWFWKRRSNS